MDGNLHKIFASLDKDASGSIEAHELSKVCKVLDLDVGATIAEMEDESDAKDSRVTFEEFKWWWIHALPTSVLKQELSSDGPMGRHLRHNMAISISKGGTEDFIVAYMQGLRTSCATVKDPISNATLDITKQCVNLSLTQDGVDAGDVTNALDTIAKILASSAPTLVSGTQVRVCVDNVWTTCLVCGTAGKEAYSVQIKRPGSTTVRFVTTSSLEIEKSTLLNGAILLHHVELSYMDHRVETVPLILTADSSVAVIVKRKVFDRHPCDPNVVALQVHLNGHLDRVTIGDVKFDHPLNSGLSQGTAYSGRLDPPVHLRDFDPTKQYRVSLARTAHDDRIKDRNVTVQGAQLRFTVDIKFAPFEVPRKAIATGQPILVSGPAACGKSTITKQYTYHVATQFLEREGELVPLLVTVIDLAETVKARKLKATDDVLLEHLRRAYDSEHALVTFFASRREQRKLVLLLDGIDEAGEARAVLEPYIATKLAGEVSLCLTGRENGIEDVAAFARFAHFHVQALTERQQRQIVASRMAAASVREGEVTLDERVDAFMGEMRRGFDTLGTTPLLLNLMVSEYLRHEARDGAIQFDGRIVDGEDEYHGSFPGVHFREWGRVTQVLTNKSVACVFVPGSSPIYGKHDPDPDSPGKCYCQSQLYHDTPDDEKRKQGYLMDEAELSLGVAAPKVGDKVEVELTFSRVRGATKYTERKWWLCSVVRAGEGYIGVTPPGYSMQQFEDQDGMEREEEGGETFFRLPADSARRNTSGARRTSIEVGQAPFGCVWYGKWVEKVAEAEAKGQRAVVVYKKGKKGKRWPGSTGGLGYSQMKEVQFLRKKYPQYDETRDGYDPARGLKEISARDFEEANALNRAQIYASATAALLGEAGLDAAAAQAFLSALAYASHTRDGAQFRSFTDEFAAEVAAALPPSAGEAARGAWEALRPRVRRSQFPLIVWEPTVDGDAYLFVHLSFQEYFAARHLVEALQGGGGDGGGGDADGAAALDAFARKAAGKGAASGNELAFELPFGFKLGDALHAELDRAGKTKEGEDVTDVVRVTLTTPAALGPGCRFGFECALRVDNSGLHEEDGGWKEVKPDAASDQVNALECAGGCGLGGTARAEEGRPAWLRVEFVDYKDYCKLCRRIESIRLPRRVAAGERVLVWLGDDRSYEPDDGDADDGDALALDHLMASERYQVVVQMADELTEGRPEAAATRAALADALLCPDADGGVRVGTGLGSANAVATLTCLLAQSARACAVDASSAGLSAAGASRLADMCRRWQRVARLDISKNPEIGATGFAALVAALPDASLVSLVLGPKSFEIPVKMCDGAALDCSAQHFGPGETLVLAWWLSTPATAAVESVDISGNEQMGAEAGAMLAKVMPDSNIKSFKFGKSAEISIEKCEATALDFSSQNFGPGEVIVISWWLSTPATAAVTSVDLSRNNLASTGKDYDDDLSGWKSLCSMLHTTKIKILWVSGCNFKAKAISTLATQVTWSTAAVERVDVLGNPMGDSVDLLIDIFKKTERIRTMCGIEEGTTDLNLSKRNMDPSNVRLLAMELSSTRATAAVTSVDLSENAITGNIDGDGDIGYLGKDADTSGIEQLAKALPSSSITDLNISNCGICPPALTIVSSTLSTAAVTSVDLSGNAIGVSSSTTVDKSTAETNCEAKQGVYASVDGDRFGRIKADPDSDNEVKLIWLDDGSESRYTKVDKLTVVVDGSSLSVTEVFSHVEALAAAISTSKTLQVLNISNCNFGPTGVSTLSTEVTWSTAAVTSVDLSGNPLTGEFKYGSPAVGDDNSGITAISDTLMKSKITNLKISNCGIGPSALSIVSSTLSTAAVESVDLSKNFITAPISRDGDNQAPWKSYDSDLSGLEALCDALTSSGITSVNLAENLFGAKAISTLSTRVTWSTAAVESVNILKNPIGDDGLKILMDTFEKAPQLGSICGVKKGQEVLDLSNQSLSPFDMKILAADFAATRATAAVTSVDLSGNSLTGGEIEDEVVEVGDDNSGVTAIADVLPTSKITNLIISNCGIGPSALEIVSSTLSTAVERVDLSNNKFDPSIIDDELKAKVQIKLDKCKP